MIDTIGIPALPMDGLISSQVARTDKVRVEYLRCKTQSTIVCSISRPEVSLMWVDDMGSEARFTLAGRPADSLSPGRASLWFFPEGVDALGRITGKRVYRCAGVFVDPSFLPSMVKEALAEPIVGFSHEALGQSFDELVCELTKTNDVLPLFVEGWAMKAMAYVARAARAPQPSSPIFRRGLAPWQLRRAQEMFRADLSENLSMSHVSAACKLSVGQFTRAFKASTGKPPHQWVMNARVDLARHMLVDSATPLVHVAGMCGFADQSHFSRVFARTVGTSPGAWRRENQV